MGDWALRDQGFRLNLGEVSEMIIFGPLLTSFDESNIFLCWGSNGNLLQPNIKKPSNQVKLFLIPDTDGWKGDSFLSPFRHSLLILGIFQA